MAIISGLNDAIAWFLLKVGVKLFLLGGVELSPSYYFFFLEKMEFKRKLLELKGEEKHKQALINLV